MSYYVCVEVYEHVYCLYNTTFPQGESHSGSPGLDTFHKAKSFSERFSLSLSVDKLNSPTTQ